jgi:hypothetical protein
VAVLHELGQHEQALEVERLGEPGDELAVGPLHVGGVEPHGGEPVARVGQHDGEEHIETVALGWTGQHAYIRMPPRGIRAVDIRERLSPNGRC